jgi:hypothetical protein
MKNNNNNFQDLGAKVSLAPSLISWVLALALGLSAMVTQADEFRYRYVPLDQAELPLGFISFQPAAINDSGRVYGTACVDDDCITNSHIAYYKDGTVTVSPSVGFTGVVNEGGTVGGGVWTDPLNFFSQAALFRGDRVKLIPRQPGEVSSSLIALNDSGTALVESDDTFFTRSYVLYSKGEAIPLDFGPTVTNPSFFSLVFTGKFINNEGIIAGITDNGDRFNGTRGFRFDTHTGETTLLNPLPTDTLAWGLGINNHGDVLGYSFVISRPYHENIGVWDHNGHFKTYFTETISSNMLLFNDNNLIVITSAPGQNSYVVPKPGVRLNLVDLVGNLPLGSKLSLITGLNNEGDMIGFNFSGVGSVNFLLKRIE